MKRPYPILKDCFEEFTYMIRRNPRDYDFSDQCFRRFYNLAKGFCKSSDIYGNGCYFRLNEVIEILKESDRPSLFRFVKYYKISH